jgi:predicted transcriptional regulator
MEQWQVSALPVLEGDGRVIGVVSEADLLPKEEFRDSGPDRFTQLQRLSDLAKAGAVSAEELMSTPAVTVHADATLAEAARIMAMRHVKRLPVVNAEGVLEGVVSRGDLLKVFLRPDNHLADEIRRDIVDVLFPAPVESVHITVTEGVATLTGRVTDAARIPLAVRLVRGAREWWAWTAGSLPPTGSTPRDENSCPDNRGCLRPACCPYGLGVQPLPPLRFPHRGPTCFHSWSHAAMRRRTSRLRTTHPAVQTAAPAEGATSAPVRAACRIAAAPVTGADTTRPVWSVHTVIRVRA